MNEMAKVVEAAEACYYRDIHSSAWGLPEYVAKAVRDFLLSDEAVERAASAMADEVNLSLAGFDERTRSKYIRQARAAITALLKDPNA